MTCASCATRIERKLSKLDGVEASVNFATEQAAVSYDPARTAVEDLLRAVEAGGDDGHADLDRHAGGLGLVGRGAGRTRGRAYLLRGRRGDHDADPAWPLPGGAGEATLERSDSCAARARREGGHGAPRGAGGRRARRGAAGG